MSKHTPEPWRVGRPGTVVSDTPVPGMGGSDAVEYYGGHLIGESITEANARRIVACVNACKGLDTAHLESSGLVSVVGYELIELTEQRDELLEAMRQTLDMLRVTSHGPSAANKAEEMLHAAICSLGADHFPGAAKMVAHEGWQLVPVEPTPEMRLAGVASQAEKLKRYALGGSLPPIDHGIPDAYRAILAAAPKPEGGAA